MLSKLHYRWWVPYAFVLPGFLLYVLWMVYPLFFQLQVSFYDWKILPGQTSDYVGLANYQDVLKNSVFGLALRNTIMYTVVTLIGQLVFGLFLAILVNRVIFGKRIFRAIYYLPVVTSWLAVSFLFRYLFDPSQGGMINYLLTTIGAITKPIAWLNEATTAWIVLFIVGIWKGCGWAMVIFLAALQGVPQELYETAAIDGAGFWKQFRHITIPVIQPTILFVSVALTIGGFNVFPSVYFITNGGPVNRTEVLLAHMYKRSFSGEFELGYGAAASYLLALMIIGFNVIQMRLFNRRAET